MIIISVDIMIVTTFIDNENLNHVYGCNITYSDNKILNIFIMVEIVLILIIRLNYIYYDSISTYIDNYVQYDSANEVNSSHENINGGCHSHISLFINSNSGD